MPDNLWQTTSVSGKPVRLTRKVWFDKIVVEHPEFAIEGYLDEARKAVESPEYVVEGWNGEFLALRWCISAPRTPKHICIVYRELPADGFVITAFFISRYGKLLNRRKILWSRKPL